MSERDRESKDQKVRRHLPVGIINGRLAVRRKVLLNVCLSRHLTFADPRKFTQFSFFPFSSSSDDTVYDSPATNFHSSLASRLSYARAGRDATVLVQGVSQSRYLVPGHFFPRREFSKGEGSLPYCSARGLIYKVTFMPA